MVTGVDLRFEDNGFDYLNLGVSYGGASKAPQSFEGVSGAGVWQFPLGKKAEEPLTALRYDEFYLIGVAFFQSPIVDGKRFIRAHGQETIYRFLPNVTRANSDS